ncbi:MAG: hypothetical protein NUV69_00715 [Candidatus Curtissbacteria bacterium]|nr:hypothetical protein [Candidatus Curtissbacteria bacterium]
MSKEGSPWDQAFRDVPRRWYEVNPWVNRALSVGSALLINFANERTIDADSIPAGVASASFYLLWAFADRYSTREILKENIKAAEVGIQELYTESNPLTPDLKDPNKAITSKRWFALDSAATTIAVLVPGYGVGFGLSEAHATFNNWRIRKRTKRAIEIAQAEK